MDNYINPFFVAGRIPPEFFCDRDTETKRLTGCILNGENVVLTSPRRVGKTELVYHCFDEERLKDKFFRDIRGYSSHLQSEGTYNGVRKWGFQEGREA